MSREILIPVELFDLLENLFWVIHYIEEMQILFGNSPSLQEMSLHPFN